MRGQLSVEFIIVLTGLLLVVATVTMPMYNQARADSEKMARLSEAREAAGILAGALNSVYASGPGSKLTVEYSLPKGTVSARACGYDWLEVDGLLSTTETVPINGRADVQLFLDLDGDGAWDNIREAVIVVDTILPSRWREDAAERDDDWVIENCVHVEEGGLSVGPTYGTVTAKTTHLTTLTYLFDASLPYSRRIVIIDEIS